MQPLALLPALLPDFSLILLGAGLRRGLHLGDHFWNGVEKLVYFVLFPTLLFNGLVRTRIDWAAALPLLGVTGAAMLAGILLGHGLRLFRLPARQFASHYQVAFRFNSYIGLALMGSLHGAAGVAAMAIIVGVMVPPANAAAVWMLARHGEQHVLEELARNPLIIATSAGLLANLAGFAAPEVALRILGRLSDAAVALGLLAVGAGLRLQKVGAGETATEREPAMTGPDTPHAEAAHSRHRARIAPHIYLLTVKLLVLPALAFWLGRALHLPRVYSDAALVFAGLPVASSAYILTQRMGGDGPGVAWLISASTLLAMLSLPLWLTIASAP